MERNKHLDKILILGIGALLFLCISESSYIIKSLLKDVFILKEMNPKVILIGEASINIIYFIVILLISLKYLKKQINLSEGRLKTLFFSLIFLYFLIQILQFLYQFYGIPESVDSYSKNFEIYLTFCKEHPLWIGIGSFVYYIQIILFGIIIYNQSKNYD